MNAKIIFYAQKKLDQNTKFKLRRKLLGIEQKSNFSRYKYQIKGALNQIEHYRPVDSTIIVKKDESKTIIDILKEFNAEYEIFDIKIPSTKLTIK